MLPSVSFWAGEKAFIRIREKGLSPDDVKIVAGAAGGPKWLVLNHLDRALFSSWFHGRKTPLFLIGSSIGAWRFAAVSRKDPLSALDRFEKAYVEQTYTTRPTPEMVKREVVRILEQLMGLDGGPSEIISHPLYRLNILAVRCRGLTGCDEKMRLIPALLLSALGNAIFRGNLRFFFERTLFYDPREIPPFFNMKGFPIHRVPLNVSNIKPALMASGAIPLIMPGEKDIPDAPSGVYRDGGVIDYHLNIPFTDGDNSGIVLFPHYAEKIVPGWLDKKISWRKPELSYMDHLLMIAPTRAFLDRLPYRKIPDRTDFRQFHGRDKERMSYWRKAVDLSRQLADEFMEAVETGAIRDRIRPIAELI